VIALNKVSASDRALAGVELAGRILFWLVMFVPCTVWFLLAVAFGSIKRSWATRSGQNGTT
jgi:hypothetical protein